ncbi:MAG: hypothetical protein ACRDTQ_01415 [Micromonosporaceae bacterium]
MLPIFVDHQPVGRVARGGVLHRDSYTDTTPVEDELPKYAVAAICSPTQDAESAVVAIGTFRRGIRVTSFSRRYEIAEISLLQRPVPTANIAERLSPQTKPHIASALTRKRALPKTSSISFKQALTDLAPDAADLIERAAGSPRGVEDLSIARRHLLAEEKDALGLAAELANVGRDPGSVGRKLMVPSDEIDPNRTHLETVLLGYNDEDALIDFDAGRFDGILGQRARRNARGVIIPLRDGRKLAVLNTNRTDLEHTRGCDLIYYDATRHSGLLVQYKRMRPEATQVGNRWAYRGDKKLAEQIKLMRQLRTDKVATSVAQYRLNAEPRYIKVVRPHDYDGKSADLMKGLYLPLDLVDLMHNSPADSTKGGNLRIAWDDNENWLTQRHLNNTRFTQLFQDGWIGSRGTASDEIRGWLDPLFEADELVTLAITDRPSTNTARRQAGYTM